MSDGFAQLGCDVHLIARSGDGPPDSIFSRYDVAPSFTFHPLAQRGPRGLHTALFLRDVRERVREIGDADLYFARDIYSLAMLAGDGIPAVFEAHRTMSSRTPEALALNSLSRRPHFAKLVTVTSPMMDEFVRQFPNLHEDRRLVLANAADDMFTPAAAPAQWWPGRPGAVQVGYVGHLYSGRGVETLVGAAEGLPSADIHLVGGEAVDVERWRASGVPENLHFHGYVPFERVRSFYAHFDILAAPYGERVLTAGGAETSAVMSPLKLYEYLSTGKAIVASDLPAIRDVLSDGEDALLVPPSDVDCLRSALQKLTSDAALRQRLGQQARRRFEQERSWVGRASELLAQLNGLAGSSPIEEGSDA